MKNIDQSDIKKRNRRRIIEILYQEREVTRQDIARTTGLSLPTVTNNLNYLLQERIALEVGQADSTGGRKPVLIRFNPDAGFVVGVEVQPDSLRCLVTNLDLTVIHDRSVPSPSRGEGILDDISFLLKNVLRERKIPTENVIGAGVCFPGVVDKKKAILEFAPNMGLRNLDLKRLTSAFPFPVSFENEANAAALAELKLGVAQSLRNLIYISIGSGVGSGIILGGKLYRGTGYRGGEIGHMILVPGGKACNCGNRGCLEQYISEKALERDFFSLTRRGNVKQREPEAFPACFVSALEEGVPGVRELLRDYLRNLATGLHNLTALLDPHYIVIGGRMAACLEMYKQDLEAELGFVPPHWDKKQPELLISSLKEKSVILGAALIPLEKLFSPVKRLKTMA